MATSINHTLELLRAARTTPAAVEMPASGLRAVAAEQSATLRSIRQPATTRAWRPSTMSMNMNRAVEPVAKRTPTATPTATPTDPPRSIAALNELLATIPASRYALERKDGGIDFLEVKAIGRGRRLVVQLHGAPGSFRQQILSVRLQGFAALHILDHGTAASAKLFADQVGECARCGSPLTQDASRARGLGPKCATYF